MTIVSAVESMACAFTVDEIGDAVCKTSESAVSTATMYRAVAAMESSGFIERVGTRQGSALYARCSGHLHHHHIVCDGCGKVAQTPCPLEPTSAAQPVDGFTVTRHEVTLYGLCSLCAEKSGR